MKLDLFSSGDRVLLVGEGNFSFSVCLLKHCLPINITATCFEPDISYDRQSDNIDYLKSKNVPIYFNVDARKLHECDSLAGRGFTKILFNFPHVGGKMKIHLNRKLLEDFFASASRVVSEDGHVVVSLCQGQGGTPFDAPQRRWSDTWQVAESAAAAGFVLDRVDTFDPGNFPGYTCVGYRSQDVKFNLSGALVHVFARRTPPFANLTPEAGTSRLALVQVHDPSDSRLPVTYAKLMDGNPLSTETSPVSFLWQTVLQGIRETGSNLDVRTDVARFVVRANESEEVRRTETLNWALGLCRSRDSRAIVSPVVYLYEKPGKDFVKDSPITIHFLITGEKLLDLAVFALEYLISVFKDKNVSLSVVQGEDSNLVSVREFVYGDGDGVRYRSGVLYSLRQPEPVDVCLLNVHDVFRCLFKIDDWRVVWEGENRVRLDDLGQPRLRQVSLFPLAYRFDVTLRRQTGDPPLSDDDLCDVLRVVAGHLIEAVDPVSEYESPEGWSSKSYRITYRSLSGPLCRRHAIRIHTELIGPALERALNVVVG